MPRVGILSPSIATADAVSNDLLGMYDALRKHGHDVRIFSETKALNNREIFNISGLRRFHDDDVLIYHYSVGWAPILSLLKELRCHKVIKYHNVTPSQFFSGFNSFDEQLCETGRKQLADV